MDDIQPQPICTEGRPYGEFRYWHKDASPEVTPLYALSTVISGAFLGKPVTGRITRITIGSYDPDSEYVCVMYTLRLQEPLSLGYGRYVWEIQISEGDLLNSYAPARRRDRHGALNSLVFTDRGFGRIAAHTENWCPETAYVVSAEREAWSTYVSA